MPDLVWLLAQRLSPDGFSLVVTPDDSWSLVAHGLGRISGRGREALEAEIRRILQAREAA